MALYTMGVGIQESVLGFDEIDHKLDKAGRLEESYDEPGVAFELVERLATARGGRVLQSSMDSQGPAGTWEWRTIFAPDVDALRAAVNEDLDN